MAVTFAHGARLQIYHQMIYFAHGYLNLLLALSMSRILAPLDARQATA